MKKAFIVDVRPGRSESISAKEYLKLQSESPTLIKKAEFVPPSVGIPGFGHFRVRYTRARLKSLA